MPVVRIFGAPVPGCRPGTTWRDATDLVRTSLTSRFGGQVEVEYIEFLPPKWKDFPTVWELVSKRHAKLPIVTVDDAVVSCGGKVSVGKIKEYLIGMGLR